MIQITPEEEVWLKEGKFLSLVRMIGDTRDQFETLVNTIKAGGEIDSAEMTKKLAEINKVVLACTNAEKTLDECRDKQAGIARGGYAIDMDEARAQIGCKLDQLRQCKGSGEFPE